MDSKEVAALLIILGVIMLAVVMSQPSGVNLNLGALR